MKKQNRATTDINVSQHVQLSVKPGSKIFDSGGRDDPAVAYTQMTDLHLFQLLSSPKYDEFSFLGIELQFVRPHPSLYVHDAGLHCLNSGCLI